MMQRENDAIDAFVSGCCCTFCILLDTGKVPDIVCEMRT